MIRPTTFNITTLIVLGVTCWVLFHRHRARIDTNWPLLYYAGLVIYARKFEDALNDNVIFVSIVAALLLRFEFLGGWVLKTIKLIETACMIYVIIRCVQLVLGLH